MRETSTVAQEIARFLAHQGVERVYGLPGGEVTHLIAALRNEGLEFVLTHHETGAAHMADAEAQLAGKPAVCLCTVGPGATNIVNGIANSYLDRSPVLALIGEFHDADRSEWTHMNIDILKLFRPISKLVERMYAHNCRSLLEHAWETAIDPAPGPVCIGVSSHEAQASTERTGWDTTPAKSKSTLQPFKLKSADNALRERLTSAQAPALIVGVGARSLEITTAISKLAQAWDIPIVITPKAKGWISSDNPRLAGVYASYGSAKLQTLLSDADLIIAVGLDGTDFIRPWDYGRVLEITSKQRVDPAFPAESLIADVLETLQNTALAGIAKGRGLVRAADCRTAAHSDIDIRPEKDIAIPVSSQGGIHPYKAIRAIRRSVDRDTVLVSDVGMLKLVLCQYWDTFEPNTFLVSNGLSTMAYGLPGAIGASYVVGSKPVLTLIGDGGLLMCLGELDTLARTKRKVLVLVAVDATLALIRLKAEGDNLAGEPNDFGTPDFVSIASSMGLTATRASTSAELVSCIAEHLELPGPSLIEFPLAYSDYRRMGG
jgi:acetolactate synthase-1/2/3 large subunit